MRHILIGYRSHPHPGPPHKGEGKEGAAPRQGFPSAGLRPDTPLRSGRSGPGDRRNDTLLVITGLVPVIPIRMARRYSKRDGRDKPGHDVVAPESVIPSGAKALDPHYSPNLFDFGKPFGGRRPASVRSPIQSRRSSLATVQVRPAVSFQVRPSFSLNTLASETPPSL